MSVSTELWRGLTTAGPEGVQIPLGLGQIFPNDPGSITFYYNLFSIFTLAILASVSGQRDTKYMALLIPLWAGFTMFAGWLKYDSMVQGFGILVVCSAIAMISYMQDTRHERFGIAGPGNTIIKIFTFLIVLQCVVAFTNTIHVFPDDVKPIAAVEEKYTNIDLTKEIPKLSNTGGLMNDIVSAGTASVQMGLSALRLFLECLLSIAFTSIVLMSIFPWLTQAGAAGTAFLVVLQFVIWIMDVLFILSVFYRVSLDPGW